MSDAASNKLYAKLAQIVQEVGSVAKDGKNDFFNYDYTTAESMLRALREPLASRNVVLLASLDRVEEREYQTSKGNASVITTAFINFTFVDGDTGQMHQCSWAGRGDDAADKGLGKAYTGAIKTFLREQFLIPQGDDPEADKATDERAASRVSAGASQSAPDPSLAEYADWLIQAVRSYDQGRYSTPEKVALVKGDGSDEQVRRIVPVLKAELTELGADVKAIDERFLARKVAA